MKELKLMMKPGVCPFQEVLLIVSMLYGIPVLVHVGGERPIVYKDDKMSMDDRIPVLHLQFIGGVHYNWVIEQRRYKQKLEIEDFENVE